MASNCEKKLKKNTGLSRCPMPGMIKGMITVPHGTAIAQDDFVDVTWWNAKLLAAYSLRAYFWPQFRGVENLSEQPVYESTPLGKMLVRKGVYAWRFSIKESLCAHVALFSHNSAGDEDIILIDANNHFIGTLDEDGMVRGFTADLLNVEDMVFSDGSVSSKTPLYLALSDSDEFNENGVMFKCSFVNQLYRLVDVELTVVGAVTTGAISIQVSAKCDGTPISGLLVADFKFKKASDGSAVVISTAPEDADVPGLYHLTQVGNLFVDGTVTLRTADLLTVKAYEVLAPVAIDEP